MKITKWFRVRFELILAVGAFLAVALCVQCVRTLQYTESVLVPQQAQRDAEKQSEVLSAAARASGIEDPHELAPLLKETLESADGRILWVRLLDTDSSVLAQAGDPDTAATIPADWQARMDQHSLPSRVMDRAEGRVLVTMLPFRIPRRRPPPDMQNKARTMPQNFGPDSRMKQGGPHPQMLELAIPLDSVTGAFAELRHNLILGVVVSIVLGAAIVIIRLRMPHYLRGRYLQREMQLAQLVQRDLEPKPGSGSSAVEFAAAAQAADDVGGDFYDVFESSPTDTVFVLGDISGKGLPAALLASVLQGAIRSSDSSRHEVACERINRMLCERTSNARFATLFWGVYDASSRELYYVNAGHTAPMLLRQGTKHIDRLEEGGPVLGVLPTAHYMAGIVRIDPGDTLVLYSDGINEAANPNDEQFGDDRVQRVILNSTSTTAQDLCDQIIGELTAFAGNGTLSDDRTLMVMRFAPAAVGRIREFEAVAA